MTGKQLLGCVVVAASLVAAGCGGVDTDAEITTESPPMSTVVRSTDASTSTTTSQAPVSSAPASTTTTVSPATPPLPAAAGADCGIWELLEQFETPSEIGDALLGGELEVAVVEPDTIAACLGYTTWRSELIIDGIEGDGLDVDAITSLADIAVVGNTVTSNEQILLGDEIYEARSVGEQTWLRGPGEDWFPLPEGQGLDALAELQDNAETFGVFFTVGTLTAFALVGSISYAPLTEPGAKVDAGGVAATVWSVTPERASAFARSLGADLPPSAFADATAEYWVTDNGQIVRIEIAVPGNLQLPDTPEGSIRFRLFDFGAPISIAAIDG